jgi:hypothetical protein
MGHPRLAAAEVASIHFLARTAAQKPPEANSFMARAPGCEQALDQFAYAGGWFSTYNMVDARRYETACKAVLSGGSRSGDGQDTAED